MDSGMTFTLRRYRLSKTLRLTVKPDGSVRVSAPPRASLRAIDAFVAAHAAWILAAQARFAANPVAGRTLGTAEDYKKYKKAALALASERLAHFLPVYGVTVGKISIRNQRTRWGSCNRQGNVSFNYRIALLPAELQDYLVVHELCHILAFNHSPKFWQLVARSIPNYRALRRQLRAMPL